MNCACIVPPFAETDLEPAYCWFGQQNETNLAETLRAARRSDLKTRPPKRDMTALLERALAEAQKLPAEQQDAIAALILEEIEDEARWDDAFARSQDALVKLAAEAMKEHRAGKTRDLDPETLGREQ